MKEIIIALSPTTSGDFTSSLIEEGLKPFSQKISRLAKGVPTGGEIEFADEETLGSALEKEYKSVLFILLKLFPTPCNADGGPLSFGGEFWNDNEKRFSSCLSPVLKS